MMEGNYISNIVSIRDNLVRVNGEVIFSGSAGSAFPEFIRRLYRHYEMSHLPFFKMDDLCKLGFCATELLLKQENKESFSGDKTGIVLANRSSSLDTDLSYYETIKDKGNYFPSPAVFVYTLPNIVIGELCIRNKIKGENTFFISEEFDPDFTADYVNGLLNSQKLTTCLAGWVEYFQGKYEAFLYFAHARQKKEENTGLQNMQHTAENLKNLYKEL